MHACRRGLIGTTTATTHSCSCPYGEGGERLSQDHIHSRPGSTCLHACGRTHVLPGVRQRPCQPASKHTVISSRFPLLAAIRSAAEHAHGLRWLHACMRMRAPTRTQGHCDQDARRRARHLPEPPGLDRRGPGGGQRHAARPVCHPQLRDVLQRHGRGKAPRQTQGSPHPYQHIRVQHALPACMLPLEVPARHQQPLFVALEHMRRL